LIAKENGIERLKKAAAHTNDAILKQNLAGILYMCKGESSVDSISLSFLFTTLLFSSQFFFDFTHELLVIKG
jgi:hypothetical protein